MRCGCARLVLGGAFQLLHDGENEDGGDDAEGDEDEPQYPERQTTPEHTDDGGAL